MIRSAATFISLLLAFSPLQLTAEEMTQRQRDAAEDSIREMMNGRWYDIEVIVFERLDVLEFNSDETLLQTQPRLLPYRITHLQQESTKDTDTATTSAAGEFRLHELAPECIGYPEIPPDPLHESQFDELFPAENELDASIDETGLEALPETATEAGTEAMEIPPADQGDDAQSITSDVISEEILSEPTPAEQLAAQIADFESALTLEAYVPLDAQRKLVPHVKAINRQRTLRPIWHTRWRQALPERALPTAIEFGNPADRLYGFIEVSVGRYLHVAPTIWYSVDGLGKTPQVDPYLPPSNSFGLSTGMQTSVPSAPIAQLPAEDGAYFQLRESRRLRSDEMHYIDHPKMGVVVRVEPVPIPDALLTSWLDVQNAGQ